jgi:protein kinase A
MKVLAKEKVLRTKQVEHTKNEKRLLTNVHNPFIVNVWGGFQDSTNLYMVMDFVAGGELFTLLRKAKVCFWQMECGWILTPGHVSVFRTR